MDLSILLLISSFLLLIAFVMWFLFLTDRDLTLALAEKFGRPVSIYRGQVVWITGASTGLGEYMAYELASVGAKLILTARNKQLLGQVKEKCLELSKGKLDSRDILVLSFDITDYGVQQKNVDDALRHFGKIDVLISNVGRVQLGLCKDTDNEVDKDLFEVNFFGGVSLTKLVLKHFLERKQGHIVVISSTAGKCATPVIATYVATKHALNAYYHSLKLEHYKDNIHVSVMCPGSFKSQISSSIMSTKKGEVVEGFTPCKVEMTTSRCAHLALVAAANKLHEAWFSYQPALLFVWMSQYMPSIYRRIILVFCTEKILTEVSEGKFSEDLVVWKPLFE